jgi:hypothetical protein
VTHDLVVIAALGIAGNRRLSGLAGDFAVRQVVDRGRDHGHRPGMQPPRVGAQFRMTDHIIHLAVAAGAQPVAQMFRRPRGSARAKPSAAKPSSPPA